MEWFASLLDLPQFDALFLISAVLVAGIVRGFAGFGLSALVMASCAVFIPPVELIPVCHVEGVGLRSFAHDLIVNEACYRLKR